MFEASEVMAPLEFGVAEVPGRGNGHEIEPHLGDSTPNRMSLVKEMKRAA
jgi:hypothetical protein